MVGNFTYPEHVHVEAIMHIATQYCGCHVSIYTTNSKLPHEQGFNNRTKSDVIAARDMSYKQHIVSVDD